MSVLTFRRRSISNDFRVSVPCLKLFFRNDNSTELIKLFLLLILINYLIRDKIIVAFVFSTNRLNVCVVNIVASP